MGKSLCLILGSCFLVSCREHVIPESANFDFCLFDLTQGVISYNLQGMLDMSFVFEEFKFTCKSIVMPVQ